MKFIDDLYNLYRDNLTGDEEDAVALVLGVLQEQDRDDMVKLIQDMNEDEIFQMLSFYLIEKMRQKMSEEGVGSTPTKIPQAGETLH